MEKDGMEKDIIKMVIYYLKYKMEKGREKNMIMKVN